MISDNADVSFGIVGCSLYTRLIALKDEYHTKRTHVEFKFLEILATVFINSGTQNQSIEKNDLTVLRFVGLQFQLIQTLH